MKRMEVAKEMAVALGCSHCKIVSVRIKFAICNHSRSKGCRRMSGNLAKFRCEVNGEGLMSYVSEVARPLLCY